MKYMSEGTNKSMESRGAGLGFSEADRRIIGGAFAKAEGIISSRINPDMFRDLYGDTEVDKDLRHVEQLRSRMHAENSTSDVHRASVALEAFLSDQIDRGVVFGMGSEGHVTSEFDDFVSGIDLIVEKRREGHGVHHLGLALDATLSGAHVGRKIRSIFDEIKGNFLPRIKYFSSEQAGIRGELRVPRFATGINLNHTLNVLQTWSNNGLLEAHPFVFVMLKQIEAQAVAYEEFARKCGHDQLIGRYRDIHRMVEDRRRQLRDETGMVLLPREWQDDRVSSSIYTALEQLK
jgi:hypothetical protein